MHFTNLHSLSAPRVKALFGLPPPLVAELLLVVLPERERRRTVGLERRADRKRKLVANDGRPRPVTPLPAPSPKERQGEVCRPRHPSETWCGSPCRSPLTQP